MNLIFLAFNANQATPLCPDPSLLNPNLLALSQILRMLSGLTNFLATKEGGPFIPTDVKVILSSFTSSNSGLFCLLCFHTLTLLELEF